MRKAFVIYSLVNHKFYTGRFWGAAFSADVADAEEFETMETVDYTFNPHPDADFKGLPEELAPYEIRTLYFKQA